MWKQLGIAGMGLNIIKAIYDQAIANIILNRWKIRNKTRKLLYSTYYWKSSPDQSGKIKK